MTNFIQSQTSQIRLYNMLTNPIVEIKSKQIIEESKKGSNVKEDNNIEILQVNDNVWEMSDYK